MKAEIDFTNKIFKIDSSWTLGELTEQLSTMFPSNWKEWKIEPVVKVETKIQDKIVYRDRKDPRPYDKFWLDNVNQEIYDKSYNSTLQFIKDKESTKKSRGSNKNPSYIGALVMEFK